MLLNTFPTEYAILCGNELYFVSAASKWTGSKIPITFISLSETSFDFNCTYERCLCSIGTTRVSSRLGTSRDNPRRQLLLLNAELARGRIVEREVISDPLAVVLLNQVVRLVRALG